MSDLCPQCGGLAYAPSDQCDIIWHKGAKPFGTSVVQDIDAQIAEQVDWVKRLADDLIAAEGREARLKAKLAQAVEGLKTAKGFHQVTHIHAALEATLAAIKEKKDD